MPIIYFYIALFIHLTSLVTGFGSVILIDTFGLLWLLKKVRLELVTKVADVAQKLIWTGWCGLVLSGIVLLTYKGYIDNLTQIKLFFVAMLGINGIFLHLVKKQLERLNNNENLPTVVKFRIGMTSTISQMGWWGAMTIGFLHRHWESYIQWPPTPWYFMVGIIAVFFVVWRIGEGMLKRGNNGN